MQFKGVLLFREMSKVGHENKTPPSSYWPDVYLWGENNGLINMFQNDRLVLWQGRKRTVSQEVLGNITSRLSPVGNISEEYFTLELSHYYCSKIETNLVLASTTNINNIYSMEIVNIRGGKPDHHSDQEARAVCLNREWGQMHRFGTRKHLKTHY